MPQHQLCPISLSLSNEGVLKTKPVIWTLLIWLERLLAWMSRLLGEPEIGTAFTISNNQKCLWRLAHHNKRIYAANLHQQGKKKSPTKPAIKRTANSINKKQYGHQARAQCTAWRCLQWSPIAVYGFKTNMASSVLLLSQGPESLYGAANTLSVGVRGCQGENQQAPIISLKRD